MRKIAFLLITVLLCLALLCSCDLGLKPKTLESGMDIPENGIIPESVFRELKSENQIIAFKGKSQNVSYEWTVFGSDISEPKDTDLRIKITAETENSITFSLCSSEPFGFTPVLSVYSNYLWETDNAVVYRCENGERIKACSASVTGSRKTILNFPLAECGTFVIEPERASDTSESGSDGRAISDGKQTEQDQYKTDPVPEGKPLPVEPENQEIKKEKNYTCTFSIECTSIFNNLADLEPNKLDALPTNGIIFPKSTVTFYEGESVFDVLKRVCKENGIQMEASWTPIYNSAYVEGISNLYEFDCGSGSGWMYRVDGWYPNYGCSRYQLTQGEVVEWRFTCDLGADIGGGYAVNP